MNLRTTKDLAPRPSTRAGWIALPRSRTRHFADDSRQIHARTYCGLLLHWFEPVDGTSLRIRCEECLANGAPQL